MLKQYLTLLFVVLFFSAGADIPPVAYSPFFKEPNSDISRVVQCSNGNTFLFNFRQNGGEFLLFGSDRALIKRENFTGKLAAMGIGTKGHIEGIYELKDKLVFFMTQTIGAKAQLTRITMNPATGAVEDEQMITEADWKMTMWHDERKVYSPFGIAIDEVAGTYAISTPGTSKDVTQQVLLFSADHRLIRDYSYRIIKDRYAQTFSVKLALKDSTVFHYSTERDEASGRKGQYKPVIRTIRPGSEDVVSQDLVIESDFESAEIYFAYHPGWNKLILINYKEAGVHKKIPGEKYAGKYSIIDVQNLSVSSSQELNYDPVTTYGRERFGEKLNFAGSPYDFRINQDLSFAMISEEVVQETISSSRPGSIGFERTTFYDIGVMYLDAAGMIGNASRVHSCQRSKIFAKAGHSADKGRHAVDIVPKMPDFGQYEGVDFYSFDYVHGSSGDYLIFNSHPDNFDIAPGKAVSCLGSLPRTATMVAKVGPEGQTHGYFWGAPGAEFDYRFTVIGSSHYQASTGTYAALIVEQKGKEMRTRLAWATLK